METDDSMTADLARAAKDALGARTVFLLALGGEEPGRFASLCDRRDTVKLISSLREIADEAERRLRQEPSAN